MLSRRGWNGDTADISVFFEDYQVMKLFFVTFMVVSNWAILAILTAVVSENMIRATQSVEEDHPKRPHRGGSPAAKDAKAATGGATTWKLCRHVGTWYGWTQSK